MDGNGHAIITWAQLKGIFWKKWKIQANLYMLKEKGKSNIGFEAGTQNASHPAIAVNDHGKAVILWDETDEATYKMWAMFITLPKP
ncbi:MAG: hypothetical protein HY036_03595 [Nitrospirae bacterium]|nr:hypothetical protein [Nitrospirota bacterium]MBI3351640.1 hypothetical protein [Nitrospirota bacterium]